MVSSWVYTFFACCSNFYLFNPYPFGVDKELLQISGLKCVRFFGKRGNWVNCCKYLPTMYLATYFHFQKCRQRNRFITPTNTRTRSSNTVMWCFQKIWPKWYQKLIWCRKLNGETLESNKVRVRDKEIWLKFLFFSDYLNLLVYGNWGIIRIQSFVNKAKV